MRVARLFLIGLAFSGLIRAQEGGGIAYILPIADIEISNDPDLSYITNGSGQPLMFIDGDGYRFELSAPVFGAQRSEPAHPSSSHFIAGLSWQGDSGLARIRYHQARRFHSDGGPLTASDETLRLGRLEVEGYYWGGMASFWGRRVSSEGGLRYGLMTTGIRALPYARVRYSHLGLRTRNSLTQEAGVTNAFDDVREMSVHAFDASFGFALQTNAWGFYFDPELSMGGGLLIGSTERDYAFPESWRERDPHFGLMMPIHVGFETGYKRGPFRLGFEFRVETEGAAYDDLAYRFSEGVVGLSASLLF